LFVRLDGAAAVPSPPPGCFDLSPLEGSCYFGHVKIVGADGSMTATHRDTTGGVLHALNLAPS